MCTVEDLVAGQGSHVHMLRMRPYAGTSLDVTEELKEVIARIQEGELCERDRYRTHE